MASVATSRSITLARRCHAHGPLVTTSNEFGHASSKKAIYVTHFLNVRMLNFQDASTLRLHG